MQRALTQQQEAVVALEHERSALEAAVEAANARAADAQAAAEAAAAAAAAGDSQAATHAAALRSLQEELMVRSRGRGVAPGRVSLGGPVSL